MNETQAGKSVPEVQNPSGGIDNSITANEATSEKDKSLSEASIFAILFKFLLWICAFSAVACVSFLLFHQVAKSGLLLDSWLGITRSELVVKLSKYGNLVSLTLTLGAVFITYLTLQQKKFADQRTAFYNRLHWSLDKLGEASGANKESAFLIANEIWDSRVVEKRDNNLMGFYNAYMNDLMDNEIHMDSSGETEENALKAAHDSPPTNFSHLNGVPTIGESGCHLYEVNVTIKSWSFHLRLARSKKK